MKQLNTIPVENFLEKARIAKKSGQKSVNIGIDEATLLADSLAQVMTRLAGDLDQIVQAVQQQEDIVIKMDGGSL